MYYVGLDIHQRSTSVEILDCNGKLVKRGEWKLPWAQLADQLKKDAPAPPPNPRIVSLFRLWRANRNDRIEPVVKAGR